MKLRARQQVIWPPIEPAPQPTFPGMFRLSAINPHLQTPVRVRILGLLNHFAHMEWIYCVSSGGINAATAYLNETLDAGWQRHLWNKVATLIDIGQRTGKSLPRLTPDFDIGTRQDLPDGLFSFRASRAACLVPHLSWCTCTAKHCAGSKPSDLPAQPPFQLSAVNPELRLSVRKEILELLNYFSNCGLIIPYSLDRNYFNASGAINGVASVKDKERVWQMLAELVFKGKHSMDPVRYSIDTMPSLDNNRFVYNVPEDIFAWQALQPNRPHQPWCKCGYGDCSLRFLNRVAWRDKPKSKLKPAHPAFNSSLGGRYHIRKNRKHAQRAKRTHVPPAGDGRRQHNERYQASRHDYTTTRGQSTRQCLGTSRPSRQQHGFTAPTQRRHFYMFARPGTGQTFRLNTKQGRA